MIKPIISNTITFSIFHHKKQVRPAFFDSDIYVTIFVLFFVLQQGYRKKTIRKEELAILKGRFNCLPELSLLIVSLAYNVIRIMNDIGSLKAPSWFLDMDIPNGCLLLLILFIVLKSDVRE